MGLSLNYPWKNGIMKELFMKKWDYHGMLKNTGIKFLWFHGFGIALR